MNVKNIDRLITINSIVEKRVTLGTSSQDSLHSKIKRHYKCCSMPFARPYLYTQSLVMHNLKL